MDPIITSSLIGAATSLFKTLIQTWGKDKASDKTQAKVEKWADKRFEDFEQALTVNCVKILSFLEYSSGLRLPEARAKLHPELMLPTNEMHLFDLEFEYRLEYLRLLGILNKGLREYRLTRLGAAFLAEARKRGKFKEALSHKS